MTEIKDVRRRLAALSTDGVDATSASPATSLVDCRALQDRLRELKREVLARIAALRAEVGDVASARLRRDQARESLASTQGDWQRRKEGAKKLLAGVREQVIGLVEGKHGDALEAWARLSEEIDARLAKLEEIESKLARAAGEDDALYLEDRPAVAEDAGARREAVRAPEAEDEGAGDGLYAAAGASTRTPVAKTEETEKDEFYAAVGATVQKGGKAGAYCPHCGQGIEPDDRYCRRCGHRLKED